MKIKMLKTGFAAPTGLKTETYQVGNEYDLPDYIANHFIDTGVAKKVSIKLTKTPRNPVVEAKVVDNIESK